MRLPARLPSPRGTYGITLLLVAATLLGTAQTTYQPKFKGDPARSESEANALGYMRTVIRAQQQYYKKNNKYAPSLVDLVHSGSFTKRMTQTDRGDYTVSFRTRKDGYELTMTPKQLDAEHRAFYANEDGVIHADETKAADENSPSVK
jgi:type II secretory pathway pseudopilin PulG